MRAALLALSGAIALGGCAGDMLTLSENEEGEATGAVAILDPVTGEERAVLNTKLTEAKLVNRPKPRAVKELKSAYTTLLGNLPPRAGTFVFLFGSNETRIPEAQRGKLDDIKNALDKRPGAQIEVAGFTDRDGKEDYNDEVSKKRALDVIAELRELGFPVDPEDAVGRGERAAQAAGDPDDYINDLFRKVEVIVR